VSALGTGRGVASMRGGGACARRSSTGKRSCWPSREQNKEGRRGSSLSSHVEEKKKKLVDMQMGEEGSRCCCSLLAARSRGGERS
jgi:hypothetical protein